MSTIETNATTSDPLPIHSNDGNDLNSPVATQCPVATAATDDGERPSPEDTTTIVTNDNAEEEEEDSDEYFSAQDEEEEPADEEEDGEEWELEGGCGDVPREVNLLKNDNDDVDRDSSSEDDEAPSSDIDSESEMEEDGNAEEDNDDDSSADEYETDEEDGSIASNNDNDDEFRETMSMDDSSSYCSAASSVRSRSEYDDDHELFLPWDLSPTIDTLKYDEDEEDDSSDDDDDDDDCDRGGYFHHRQRTYMMGNNRNSGRPRMWDGCPSSVSVSSNSSSSSSEGSSSSQDSRSGKQKAADSDDDSNAPPAKGVSFSDSVLVYPVFETSAYPPSMVRNMYTKRDELRVNKIRNKREFAYDLHDWRNVTEEDGMDVNEETGEYVHPVHAVRENNRNGKRLASSAVPGAPVLASRKRNVVQTYSSALGGYTTGVVHRAKRMRMYYP